jgi:hypothetical protein
MARCSDNPAHIAPQPLENEKAAPVSYQLTKSGFEFLL